MEDNEQFKAELARALEQSLILTSSARAAETSREADERSRALMQISAARRKVKARERFAYFCFIVVIVMIAVAAYVFLLGKRSESLLTFMLAGLPFVGGSWSLHRASLEEYALDKERERLGLTERER